MTPAMLTEFETILLVFGDISFGSVFAAAA